MSLVDVDSWLTEYQSCDRLTQMITEQLQQREKRQELSPEYNRLTNAIQIGLKQFETELRQIKEKLTSQRVTQAITISEFEQRSSEVEALQSKLQQLQVKFNNARNELLGVAPPLQGDPNAAATSTSGSNSIHALKQRQIEILEQQNRGLEALSQTVSRQRTLAAQLGQEVEDQHDILDNLADTMERVDTRVSVETSNISQVNRRDSTWGYWLVIIALLVAIVVTALL